MGLWAVCCFAAFLTSCDDEIARDAVSGNGAICFQNLSTRAAPTDQVESMGCLAYMRQGGLYINDEQYTRRADGVYTCVHEYYWPEATTLLDFYNYAPYGAEGLTTPSGPGEPRVLRYEVPSDPARQSDLMLAVAKGQSGAAHAPVPLRFSHLLTAVTIKAGEECPEGKVRSIEVSGIRDMGSYDMDAGQWTLDSHVSTYRFENISVAGPGSQLVGGELTLMLLPQDLEASGASISVDYVSADGIVTNKTMTLEGEWLQGHGVTYALSPSGLLRIENTPLAVDAHYVSEVVDVASSLPAGTGWTMTATASDGAAVTLQAEADVNEYVRQGYWLDRKIDASGNDTGSARGESTLSAAGSIPVRVFVPENPGNAPRTITLTLRSKSSQAEASFTQACPDEGWETIDDGQRSEYGFTWTRKAVYVYPYNLTTNSIRREATALWNELVERYNASAIAEGPVEYYNWRTAGYRYYFLIDYTNLNDMPGISSGADGYQTTLDLYRLGGSAVTGTFEAAVSSLKKTESGHETEALFRWRASNDPPGVPQPVGDPYEQGMKLFEDNGLSVVLKRNRYNLVTTTQTIGTTTAPKIVEEDIVWYWPSASEYGAAPSSISSWLNPGDSWSCTPAASPYSLLGNGVNADRSTSHFIRSRRR